MQTTASYSPEQLLEAGRRAEAQGQVGYALQFYRYLAEQQAHTAEGFEAREALHRLTPPPADSRAPMAPMGHAPPAHAPTAPPGHAQMAPQATPVAPPPRPMVGDLRAVRPEPPLGQGAATHPPRAKRSPPVAHPSAGPAESAEEPTSLPARSYRVGRFVAGMLNAIGWLLLLTAVVAIPVLVAGLTIRSFPRGLRDLISGNALVFAGSTFGALVLGLFAVFASQVARAAFDTAEGVRWLVAKSEP